MRLTFIFEKLGSRGLPMRRLSSPRALALAVGVWAGSAGAAERTFAYARESTVLAAGASELQPWTTFRVGRERYYSSIDARLGFERGLVPRLSLGLFWNVNSETRDVVESPVTGELVRISDSELASASLELKYQLTDPAADALGSALLLQATLGTKESELQAELVVDRTLGNWVLAANVGARYALASIRSDQGSEVSTSFTLEPRLAAALLLQHGFAVGLELRAPLGLSGPEKSSTLFGGPVVGWADRGYWAMLGIQPQLVAFSGQSPDSRLDLNQHERLEVRLLTGFLL